MARPKNYRRVSLEPKEIYFKPKGIPIRDLDEEILTLDEIEALRLADVEGMYHTEAAEKMGVSRATFGRIVEMARHKVASAILQGKAIRVEGGVVQLEGYRQFLCSDCKNQWHEQFGTGRPNACPSCKGENFRRMDDGPPKTTIDSTVDKHKGPGRRRHGRRRRTSS